jgi:NADH-quinone oxidoreductase subunit D
MYIAPGGVRRDIDPGVLERLSAVLDHLEARLPDYDDLYFSNHVMRRRAAGIGALSQEQALEWGVTGPNLRACGLGFDLRRDDPYLVYDRLDFAIPVQDGGDALARVLLRRAEMVESIRILRQVIEALASVDGPVRAPLPNPLAWTIPPGDTYTRTESSKGELAFYAVANNSERPWRVHVRGPSQMHAVQVLENLTRGARLEDVSQIMFSLDACPPEVDR